MSRRVNVYDDDTDTLAGWFDADRADFHAEDTRFDGSNHVSLATGSQWEHEGLYRTAGGRWVLRRWSQWQGSPRPTARYVSEDRARDWLLANSHDEVVGRCFGPIEPERGPGRPEIGAVINVRLGDDLLARVDDYADASKLSRSAALRQLVSFGLATLDRASEHLTK